MTTCASLSKEFCSRCQEVTLHTANACIHCRTEFRYDRIPDRPQEVTEFHVGKGKALGPTAGRRKGGRPRKGVAERARSAMGASIKR